MHIISNHPSGIITTTIIIINPFGVRTLMMMMMMITITIIIIIIIIIIISTILEGFYPFEFRTLIIVKLIIITIFWLLSLYIHS